MSLLHFGQRTATVIGVRWDELPGKLSQAHLTLQPIIVIEGPTQTTVLHNMLAEQCINSKSMRRGQPWVCCPIQANGRVVLFRLQPRSHKATPDVVCYFTYKCASIQPSIVQVVQRT